MYKTENMTIDPCGADASYILDELRCLTPQERRELLRMLTGQHGVSVLRKVVG